MVCVVRTRMGLVSKETVVLRQWEIDEQELSLTTTLGTQALKNTGLFITF